MTKKLRVLPLTDERWSDFETLFGPRGACAGCWCMWPRLPRAEYESGKGIANKRRMRSLVRGGQVPGVIGYLGDKPVAWCAIGPREKMVRLERSRVMAPVDDTPVWSIPCLFVHKSERRHGLTVPLVEGAAKWALAHGAPCVEAYPNDPRAGSADAFVWMGLASTFRRAGFREVARRSPTRPIFRITKR